MIATRSPLWALCCLALAASAVGVDGHAMFVSAPRARRVPRNVDTGVDASKPTMTSWRVATDVLYRYAKTTLATRLVNPASRAAEISFNAVLPQAAFISAFHIEMDGKVYDAYVKEKEAARQEYQGARDRGFTAATVVKARDSNVFTVSVNVEAAGKVTFNLTYEEILTRKLGLYHHVISIDPGQVVPELSLRVRIEDALPLANLSVPALRMSNEIGAADDVSTAGDASGPASISRPTPEVAVVEWSPSVEEQRSLRSDGLRAQLTVQYDVDRENNSAQILLGDGYFVHFYAPTTLTPLHKHAVFVLDISGSMDGAKLPQLREAMATVLDDLREGDAFSVITFESSIRVWQPNGTLFRVDRYHKELSVPDETVVAVNADNIARAKAFVANLDTLGGTNIHDALMTALDVVKLGRQTLLAANVGKIPEPLVVFLTDGQANEGAITQSAGIVRAVTAKNARRAPIFCLAFGRDADLDFLKQLALANAAFAKLIYEASDAALQLRDFYRQVASPLLANVTFKYEPEQVDNSTLTTLHFNTLFAGSELVVAGRLVEGAADEATEPLRGAVEAKAITGEERFAFPTPQLATCGWEPLHPSPPTDAPRSKTASFMERLWAHLTVQQLLDKERALGDPANSTGRTRALELALKYSFVTSLTSLVVVKPNATVASDPVEAGAEAPPQRLYHMYPASIQHSGGGYAAPPGRAGVYNRGPVPISTPSQWGGRTPVVADVYEEAEDADYAVDSDADQVPTSYSAGQALIAGDVPTQQRPQVYYPLVPPPPPGYRQPPPPPPPPPTYLPLSTTPAAVSNNGDTQLTVSDITWPESAKNATHVFVSVEVPGSPGTFATSAFLIGTGQPDVNTGICPSVGEVSYCRHMAYCVLPEFKDDFSKYASTYFCGIGSYAGVCCPGSHHPAPVSALP